MVFSSSRMVGLVILAVVAVARMAGAQALAPNQTLGFGEGRLLTFTYEQNYSCVHDPTADLDFNGMPAQSDPAEFQTPICQVATESAIDPAGREIKRTAHLYVLVPMFSVDNDQNPDDALPCPAGVRSTTLCGHDLGVTLISLFHAVPEGFKAHPLVYTQCPDPGSAPGTCTMHTSSVDLGTALHALQLPVPANTNIFVPTPNHTHVVDNKFINQGKPIWWEVRPVLVMDPALWPAKDGSSGITSAREMDAAEQANKAIEVGSNFFLFFSSQVAGK